MEPRRYTFITLTLVLFLFAVAYRTWSPFNSPSPFDSPQHTEFLFLQTSLDVVDCLPHPGVFPTRQATQNGTNDYIHGRDDDYASPVITEPNVEVLWKQRQDLWGPYFENEHGSVPEPMSDHWGIPFFNKTVVCTRSSYHAPAAEDLGVIVSLFSPSRSPVQSLRSTLRKWQHNLFSVIPEYPIVLFYQAVNKTQDLVVENDVIQLAVELGIRNPISSYPLNGTGIDFMSLQLGRDIYRHPATRSARFILRLDTDAFFESRIEFDPFTFVDMNDLDVGYAFLGFPEIGLASTRMELIQRMYSFFVSRGILPFADLSFMGNYGSHDTIVAGPFELYRRSLFTTPLYDAFLNALSPWISEDLGSVHLREQYFKSVWLRMTVPRFKMHWFCEFNMTHKLPWGPRCRRECWDMENRSNSEIQ